MILVLVTVLPQFVNHLGGGACGFSLSQLYFPAGLVVSGLRVAAYDLTFLIRWMFQVCTLLVPPSHPISSLHFLSLSIFRSPQHIMICGWQ